MWYFTNIKFGEGRNQSTYIGAVDSKSKTRKEVTVQCPSGACTVTFQKAKRFTALLCSLPSYLCLLRKMWGGDGVAHDVFDGNAMKVYMGPIVCGSPFAMHLLLKGTAT